jgi:hypothetical protein
MDMWSTEGDENRLEFQRDPNTKPATHTKSRHGQPVVRSTESWVHYQRTAKSRQGQLKPIRTPLNGRIFERACRRGRLRFRLVQNGAVKFSDSHSF